MKGKTQPVASPSPDVKPAPQKAKNRNPGKRQRQRNRERAKVQQPKPVAVKPMPLAAKPVCSNPRFHPHHCDCPVHEDVLAFIDAEELRRSAPEKPAVTAYVFHDEISPFVVPRKKDEPKYSTETPKLPELVASIISTEKHEETLQRLRDAICEIGELKSKNKGLQKAVESLENRLLEARNGRKGKNERRKKVRNKRASDKAFEHGVMGVGRQDRNKW